MVPLESCCSEVVLSTTTTGVAADFLGTFTNNPTEALVNERKVYRKTTGGREYCLWYANNGYWAIFYCNSVTLGDSSG